MEANWSFGFKDEDMKISSLDTRRAGGGGKAVRKGNWTGRCVLPRPRRVGALVMTPAPPRHSGHAPVMPAWEVLPRYVVTIRVFALQIVYLFVLIPDTNTFGIVKLYD